MNSILRNLRLYGIKICLLFRIYFVAQSVLINEAPMKYDTAFICNIGSQCHDNTDFTQSFLLAVQTLNHLVTPAIFHNIERGEKKLEFR